VLAWASESVVSLSISILASDFSIAPFVSATRIVYPTVVSHAKKLASEQRQESASSHGAGGLDKFGFGLHLQNIGGQNSEFLILN